MPQMNFLHLSCLISSYNIPVHYACSATHVHQAKLRFNGINSHAFAQIDFHEFPTPHFICPPPDPNALSNFPSHLQPSFEASLHLRHPMTKLLHKISSTTRRVIVVHDALMAYVVQDTATTPIAESYSFSATYQSKVLTYIDLIKAALIGEDKQLWAVGPLNSGRVDDSKSSNSQHKCLEWLDKQAPNSVLYVSFGTTTSMTDQEIKELAMGLEQSGQKFIWVLRDADKGDIFAGDVKRAEALPEGYEERVKGVGLVVRDWASQLEILAHRSTGGFMSHCGWNSCQESITMGVPIAAWPMHSDQPKNAFLVTDILKVGVVVKQWAAHEEEVVASSTIAKAVKRLMTSTEGEELRKRAEELGGAVQQAVKEGGVSRTELDSFIAHITR